MKKNCKILTVCTQIAVLAFFATACGSYSSTAHADAGLAVEGLKLKPTMYFIKLMDLSQHNCESKKTIFDVNEKPLIQVCADIYKRCVIEGTCAMIENKQQLDGDNWMQAGHGIELINYIKLKNNVPLFQRVNTKRCPFGYGVKAGCLDPFYTVAADMKYHQPGDVIFIPKVVGTLLPNGESHDGYFIVRDRGGAIDGAGRFDFFTGFLDYKDQKNPFTKIGLHDVGNHLPYKKVTGDAAEAIREKRNFPLMPDSKLAEN